MQWASYPLDSHSSVILKISSERVGRPKGQSKDCSPVPAQWLCNLRRLYLALRLTCYETEMRWCMRVCLEHSRHLTLVGINSLLFPSGSSHGRLRTSGQDGSVPCSVGWCVLRKSTCTAKVFCPVGWATARVPGYHVFSSVRRQELKTTKLWYFQD